MSTTTTSASSQSKLLGPLTTTWTPPSTCLQPLLACSTCSSAWEGQTCLSSATFEGNLNCWPPVTSSTATPPFLGLGYYSPGLYCPSGYQTACAAAGSSNGLQASVNGTQLFTFEYTPTVSETAVGCCPSGYACSSNNGQICAKQVASTSTDIWSCITGGDMTTTALAFPETITMTSASSATVTSTVSDFTFYAPLVQLNFQASDLSTTTSSSSQSTTSTSSTSSSSSTSASSTAASSGGSGSNHHTTTIAVAVTVPVVVVALIAAALGWFFYRKRRARNAAPPPPPPKPPTELPAQRELTEMNAGMLPVEMPTTADAPARSKFPDHGSVVHEMDSGDYRVNSESNFTDTNYSGGHYNT